MSLRFSAIANLANNPRVLVENPEAKIDSIYAINVFTLDTAKKYFSPSLHQQVEQIYAGTLKLNHELAEHFANALLIWCQERGVSHFTHWFQPLSGSTAEKHDALFNLEQGKLLVEFSSSQLIQQEGDASSFPNGGIRATFEARGYSAWDPTSPPFIYELDNGSTLCIPTIFIAYTGESLDFKAPLLRSSDKLNQAATSVVNLFNKSISSVYSTLGWEQEYFLVDEALAKTRPDLILAGRTLYGAKPAKGQQLSDHYFGAIAERAFDFMREVEFEAWKLGIPVHTRHNEVAPGQFEIVPVFEEVNVSVDHNILTMDLMSRIAKRHKLRVLFHEKPFAAINGSGKHSNWSLSTDQGDNLLSPGKTPKSNLLFLTFFINILRGISDHADILLGSIASAGNDHRLGGHEAPPAVLSIFVGDTLAKVLQEIEENVDQKGSIDNIKKLKLAANLPEMIVDNTDRNRTSPFAFTGSKFEFRAVGSSSNPAVALVSLNTIVTDRLIKFKAEVDELLEQGIARDAAVLQILRGYISESKDIIFGGDGYSDAWVEEARKRGLPFIESTPQALGYFITPKAVKLFTDTAVLSERELAARYEVALDNFTLKLQLESRIMVDLARNHVIPAAIRYQSIITQNLFNLQNLSASIIDTAQLQIVEKISEHLNAIYGLIGQMNNARKNANEIEDSLTKALAYDQKVKGEFFDILRYHVDRLETLVDDQIWPLAKYRELLLLL